MSYQFDLQQMQQLIATGRYNPMDIMLPQQHMQMMMMPLTREEPVNEILDESDEDEDDEEKRTLFCANLDERVTEELLYEVFLQAGPIEKARIPRDNSGRQRTFGFVTYVHRCSPPYAMQLYQGLALFRKSLTIKFKGNSNPSPMRNSQSTGVYNKRPSYDNSSMRGGNYSSHNDSPPQNPFKNNRSPDCPSGSGNRHDNISKHASSQSRPHTNSGPYQRHSGERSEDRFRDQDKRRYHHNGSNRRSDQRSSGSGNYRR